MVFVLGKTLVIMLVVADQHLYTPMSCFLGHLSSLETFYRSTTLPQVMAHFVTGDSTISAHHINLLFRSHPPLPVHMGILCMHHSCSAGADLPSSMRRQKAFSTCSSQLTSATVFYDTLILGAGIVRSRSSRMVSEEECEVTCI
ncbi:hypothetical protein QYF61_013941 [Mycteria americana]|uniref:Secreted protein n=1 Tax=Mycteria americana TaxID=33587 RepID=A0AAN7RSN9_MYCAM|nr:hypothetical protein QYF61_013941 [Mycteria americana]